MGRFDGILLTSDFDGTLAIDGKVPPENAKAITSFQEEGGLFSIISGRSPAFMRVLSLGYTPNAPFVGFNGAQVVDPADGRVLYDGGRDNLRILSFVLPVWELERDAILCMIIHTGEQQGIKISRGDPIEPEQIPLPVYKIVLVTAPGEGERILRIFERESGGEFLAVRSWDVGVEILFPGNDKGSAALRVKRMTGSRILVSVGDYENDIDMLRAADIGVAVGNTLPSVCAAADRITSSCLDFAVASLIASLPGWLSEFSEKST